MGLLIFVHEAGHFVFAKLFGVGVRVFSLGFGKRLFGFEYGGTDYRVSMIPAGGYVLMEGADPFQDGGDGLAEPDSPTSFMNKPVWQRLIIVAAGPIVNLLLPVVVYTGLLMAGEPSVDSVVGRVMVGSQAEQAGLQIGDEVLAVNGEELVTWMDLDVALEAQKGQEAQLRVKRGGGELNLSLPVPADAAPGEGQVFSSALGMHYLFAASTVGLSDPSSPAARAGLKSGDVIDSVDGVEVHTYIELIAALDAAPGPATLAWRRLVDEEVVSGSSTLQRDPSWQAQTFPGDPYVNDWGLSPSELMVSQLAEDSPAQAANLLEGDRIVLVNGAPLLAFDDMLNVIGAAHEGEGVDMKPLPVTLSILREGRPIEVTLTPRITESTTPFGSYYYRPTVGIYTHADQAAPFLASRKYSFTEAVPAAMDRTVQSGRIVLGVVGKLFTGRADPSKTVGGPVQIFRDAAAAAEGGLFTAAQFVAGLSISLGIVNFLPVPVLDGGQFLFYLAEGVRGRPLSLAVRERAQQIGVLLMLGLMFGVLVLDIQRWIS